MYQYPFMGYPPPHINHDDFERGMKIAERLANRRERDKERHEEIKIKRRKEERKESAAARARTLTMLEWYIIGIVSYPLVGPLYNAAVAHVQAMAVH